VLPARKAKGAHWLFRDEVSLIRDDRDLAVLLEQFTRAPYFPSHVFSATGVREISEQFARGERGQELSTLYAHLVGMAKCCEQFFGGDQVAVTPAADPARFGVAID
jgi:hypothetical protein